MVTAGDFRNGLTFELDGNEHVISENIGFSVGAYIYLIDAMDDFVRDAKTNAYNPLIQKFGTVDSVKRELETLDISVSLYAQNAKLAFALLDDGDFTAIINNILEKGLGAQAYKIYIKNGEKNDRSL